MCDCSNDGKSKTTQFNTHSYIEREISFKMSKSLRRLGFFFVTAKNRCCAKSTNYDERNRTLTNQPQTDAPVLLDFSPVSQLLHLVVAHTWTRPYYTRT